MAQRPACCRCWPRRQSTAGTCGRWRLGASGQPIKERPDAAPLPEGVSGLSRLSSLALHGAPLSDLAAVTVLTALLPNCVRAFARRRRDPRPLRHPLSALTSLDGLQVRA